MKKKICLILIFTAIVSTGCKKKSQPSTAASPAKTNANLVTPPTSATADEAIKKAQAIFAEQKNQGVNMVSGPCLSNDLLPDWVADIAHNPRLRLDNLASNQCPAYAAGQAHHFVELDPEGHLIRVL